MKKAPLLEIARLPAQETYALRTHQDDKQGTSRGKRQRTDQ
jgi:hypothetical protein